MNRRWSHSKNHELGSSKLAHSSTNYIGETLGAWNKLSTMHMEPSLIIGGSMSLAFLSFMRSTYSIVSYIIENAIDIIVPPEDIKYKYNTFQIESNGGKQFVVRDDSLGGLIINAQGLYYVDGCTLNVYKYDELEDSSHEKNIGITRKSFSFKLAPYVQRLYEKLDFKTEKGNVDRSNTFYIMMNDLVVHMILNDIRKVLQKSEKVSNVLEEGLRESMRKFIAIIKKAHIVDHSQRRGLYTSQSQNKSSSYDILASYSSANPNPNELISILKNIEENAMQHQHMGFNYSINDRSKIMDSREQREKTGFIWDREYIQGLRPLEIIIEKIDDQYPRFNIKYWKPLFRIRYRWNENLK